MSGTTPVSSPAMMSAVVYGTLRQEILGGALQPAAKLRIGTLCDRYRATSTPVREALNQLASEGFVRRREQRGFFVAEASSPELEQLTDTRCWVEPIALREAIGCRSAAWEESIVLAGYRLAKTDRSSSATGFTPNPAWEAAHRTFHQALIASCPSRWLVEFCALLSDHATRYRNLSMAVAYPSREVTSEHRLLMEATLGGDVALASDRLVRHYRLTAAIIHGADGLAPGAASTPPRGRSRKPGQATRGPARGRAGPAAR